MLPKKLREAYRRRVAKGVKALDKKVPTWWRKINLAKLVMSRPDVCIIGQIKGEYDTDNILAIVNGLAKNIDDDELYDKADELAIQHGLNRGNTDFEECNGEECFSYLAEIWTEVVLTRLAKMPRKQLVAAFMAAYER